MMKFASVDLECEAKSVAERQTGSLFTTCSIIQVPSYDMHVLFRIGDASLNELPIEHGV